MNSQLLVADLTKNINVLKMKILKLQFRIGGIGTKRKSRTDTGYDKESVLREGKN